MAVQMWALGPNQTLENVLVGPTPTATSSFIVNVLVDMTNTNVTDNSVGGTNTRAILKGEVLKALTIIQEQILRGNWPP